MLLFIYSVLVLSPVTDTLKSIGINYTDQFQLLLIPINDPQI